MKIYKALMTHSCIYIYIYGYMDTPRMIYLELLCGPANANTAFFIN